MKKALFTVFVSVLLACSFASVFVVRVHAVGTISYNAASDIISVVGDVNTFEDVYQADVAGGWGQVTKQGASQYCFDCKLVVGDGSSSTYLYGVDVQLEFVYDPSTNNEKLINVTGNGILRLGDRYLYAFEDYLLGAYGASVIVSGGTESRDIIYSVDSSSARVYLFSVSFSYIVGSGQGTLRFNDADTGSEVVGCIFPQFINIFGFNGYIYRGNFIAQAWQEGSPYLASLGSSVVVDDIICTGGGAVFQVAYRADDINYTLRNVVAGTMVNMVEIIDNSGTVGVHLVDCSFDDWTFWWSGSNPSTTVYRQTSFDLFVLNGALTDFVEDANVTLTHDGTVFGSWLTNSTGQIDTKTLTYGFYNQTGGDTMYGGTAWTLTITHPDWQTYESKFYPYSEIDWSISMQDTSTANNNILLTVLMVGALCFSVVIVFMKRGN